MEKLCFIWKWKFKGFCTKSDQVGTLFVSRSDAAVSVSLSATSAFPLLVRKRVCGIAIVLALSRFISSIFNMTKWYRGTGMLLWRKGRSLFEQPEARRRSTYTNVLPFLCFSPKTNVSRYSTTTSADSLLSPFNPTAALSEYPYSDTIMHCTEWFDILPTTFFESQSTEMLHLLYIFYYTFVTTSVYAKY